MKYSFLALVILIPFLNACAPASVQKVYIPTKCDIEVRKRPPYDSTKSLAYNLSEIFKYTELLEKDLIFCTKE